MTEKWPERDIDHEDTDKLNDRWSNLRLATESQNGANRRIPKNNTSGFKGVFYHTQSRKWVAQIYVNYKQKYLGGRNTPEEASALYIKAAEKYFGEYAREA